MEKSYKVKFLEKSILGQKIELELNNSEEIILKCIHLAYKDMLTSGRFYLSNDENNNTVSRCNRFKSILEDRNYNYSRDLIEKVFPLFADDEEIRKDTGNRYATRYGLAQKLVNMAYKYFYVFYDYIDKEIDFSKCDCPLDSIILRKLELDYVWSKITKHDYEYCQELITECLKNKENLDSELKSLGNLAFDFRYW